MPMVLELCDEDVEVMLRGSPPGSGSSALLNPTCANPILSRGLRIAGRIRATSQQGGFYSTRVCNKPLSSQAALNLPGVPAEFDFSEFGK